MRTMKRVLVTGVAGFIGSSLAQELLRSGCSVVGIDNISQYYPAELKRSNLKPLLAAGLEFHEGKLSSGALSALLGEVDTVFHQAGQPGVRPSWGSSFHTYTSTNIDATQTLLEAVKVHGEGVERVVYASSSSIYGDAETFPTPESTTPRPVSPYGVTKLAGEHLMRLYAANFAVPTVSLRYFTVYGPRQRPDMAFTRFLSRARMGIPLVVYGDGTQVRDFTYVEDVVRANICAATSPSAPPGSVYNISGGSSVSVRDVLGLISEVLEQEVRVSYVDRVAGDARRTGGDSSKAHADLSWAPEVRLPEGLSAQAAWVHDNIHLLQAAIGS